MIYALALGLFLLSQAPQLLWDAWRKQKKIATLSERFGLSLPQVDPTKPLIWIHAVSVGEVKAVRLLLRALRLEKPNHIFFLTTTTLTGQEEASRSLPELDAKAILPFDFSWIARRFVRALRPEMFLLVESDFWRNYLYELKRSHCVMILVNGKLSERSFRRFSWLPHFASSLFSSFDRLLVQNQEHANRFAPFLRDPTTLSWTGNIKLDPVLAPVELAPWQEKLRLAPEQLVLSLVSTHAPEEAELLQALQSLLQAFPTLLFCIAPRHAERTEELGGKMDGQHGCRHDEMGEGIEQRGGIAGQDGIDLDGALRDVGRVLGCIGHLDEHVDDFFPMELGILY